MGYIAYQGQEYTIEWYVNQEGRSYVGEYAEGLSNGDRKKLIYGMSH